MSRNKLWLLIALVAIGLIGSYSLSYADHPNVPLLDKNGNAVTGNTPYSPKQTCSNNSCHQGNPTLAAKHNYGSGSVTVSQHVGRKLADNSVTFTTQTVNAYAHGVSVSKHVNMGRNENLTAQMRTAWGNPYFISTPGMFGRY